MGLKHHSGAHSKHVLTYHLVWCVKYRHTLLTRQIGDRVKEIIREIATQIECEIIETETDTDHVHVLIRLKPSLSVSQVLHRLKGASARRIFQEFPQLRRRLWGGHLWSPSSFSSTVGGVTLEAIKKYVREQRENLSEESPPLS
jgi:putative transposase